MLESTKYKDVSKIASDIRNKFGMSKEETKNNLQNSAWIMQNLHHLEPPDIALLAEYNRDVHVREKIVQVLYSIRKT